LFVPLGVANLTAGFPGLLPMLKGGLGGNISSGVGINGLCPALG
jgi:hypothetical protein